MPRGPVASPPYTNPTVAAAAAINIILTAVTSIPVEIHSRAGFTNSRAEPTELMGEERSSAVAAWGTTDIVKPPLFGGRPSVRPLQPAGLPTARAPRTSERECSIHPVQHAPDHQSVYRAYCRRVATHPVAGLDRTCRLHSPPDQIT